MFLHKKIWISAPVQLNVNWSIRSISEWRINESTICISTSWVFSHTTSEQQCFFFLSAASSASWPGCVCLCLSETGRATDRPGLHESRQGEGLEPPSTQCPWRRRTDPLTLLWTFGGVAEATARGRRSAFMLMANNASALPAAQSEDSHHRPLTWALQHTPQTVLLFPTLLCVCLPQKKNCVQLINYALNRINEKNSVIRVPKHKGRSTNILFRGKQFKHQMCLVVCMCTFISRVTLNPSLTPLLHIFHQI